MTIKMLDIDGFRYDKAIQSTVDASAEFSDAMRQCARSVGKENFFLPGEITGGNNIGSVYLGRGRQPNHWVQNVTEAVSMTINSAGEGHLRNHSGMDAGAFHYSIYRSMTRFLGMDGNLEAGFDLPVDWVAAWMQMMLSNDMVNPNTGIFDPRHMYGTTNQDVFRWPGIQQGTERMLLGQFVTTLLLPGIPLLLWGEEQAFYILDSTADNYIFGRQAMSSTPAWYLHGCYAGNSAQYFQFPMERNLIGCEDETQSYDHRDPTAPVRNVMKELFHLRNNFPVLNDGFYLQKLSNQTRRIVLPGSNKTATEFGLWSVVRAAFPDIQDLGDTPPIWLVYHNVNETVRYEFDCSSNNTALLSPFAPNTTVRNLIFPHDEITLSEGPGVGGFNTTYAGCNATLRMDPYDYRAYVPVEYWVPPPPMITRFLPGHDRRIQSNGSEPITIDIELHFSADMDCDDITNSITIDSVILNGSIPILSTASVKCTSMPAGDIIEKAPFVGAVASAWSWSATLTGVEDGVHLITVRNATTADKGSFTNTVDKFLLRVGSSNNPIAFPLTANYSSSLLTVDEEDNLWITHDAAGATQWRYSLNWASSWSDWMDYNATATHKVINRQYWSGAGHQAWKGEHVIVQYFSNLLGSSSFVQHGDAGFTGAQRRFPHMYAQGPFNTYGFDAGIRSALNHNGDGSWSWPFMFEWPNVFQLNVWGINPDGQPDQTVVLGDPSGDQVLDRLPPSSLLDNVVNITEVPPSPYLAYALHLHDATLRYQLEPIGNRWMQLILYFIFWLAPILTSLIAVIVFRSSFYQVKIVEKGVKATPSTTLGSNFYGWLSSLSILNKSEKTEVVAAEEVQEDNDNSIQGNRSTGTIVPNHGETLGEVKPRTVLLATIEYNIDDWKIKVKIGGLGVMAQLMSNSLPELDLVWVVPCVGGITYPVDDEADPMYVTILNKQYKVNIQYHKVRNITYVLLDAPVFRRQTKSEPYPPRMDDLDSAIYYSTWNQCIAQTIDRFTVDIYHVNDYHGAAAMLYHLPYRTIPCCLSLHNAEFQGLWPMRTDGEMKEVCEVYNLPQLVVQRYVQFGSVFNLLHAACSYLRYHQSGFGAVGVSKKYGNRSFARYAIFWGLSHVGQLPNPDPSDTEQWDPATYLKEKNISVDPSNEEAKKQLKQEAQCWAGLTQDADAELFVFVGRWSQQKGIDLIADIFPGILDKYPKTQLVCVGPVVDLYGKFAALKLEKLMEKYPGRVFSRPQFTELPPCLFSGAEFALIPSRDEPFGLVAVEFGRKGALGVGARVGGLGQMPGWWYTIESLSPQHLLEQLKQAVFAAISSRREERAQMRAWSAKQRFPVAVWRNGLEALYAKSIKNSAKVTARQSSRLTLLSLKTPLGDSPLTTRPSTPTAAITGRNGSGLLTVPGNPTTAPNRMLSTPGTPVSPSPSDSVVDIDCIVNGRSDFQLQKLDPLFVDAGGRFEAAFKLRLQDLSAANSANELCIEKYIVKSERLWYDIFHRAKLGSFRSSTSSSFDPFRSMGVNLDSLESSENGDGEIPPLWNAKEEFGLDQDYIPPTGIKKLFATRIGTWPVYSFLVALGQIMASNSYQVTLLTGEIGQPAEKLYTVAGIYFAGSLFWGGLSRFVMSRYILSFPFVFYGLAFFLVGIAPAAGSILGTGWIQNAATGLYSFASASGGLFFSLNFGDEGGTPVSIWIWRATVIQGFQQAYVLALWAWGSYIAATFSAGDPFIIPLRIILPITITICLILWSVGACLFFGLPEFYHRVPESVPGLYLSLLKRKTTIWFFVYVVLQNYFLSTLYGRNWFFLFSSQHAPTWSIWLLAFIFFIGVWALFLTAFRRPAKRHPWMLPIFAIGLGAPRWCQMLWGTSGYGNYLPWASASPVVGALASRALWLWLGVLDTIQSSGIGMILMLTLTRIHMSVTLITAQCIGSIVTILARATAPHKLGPGPIFPNFAFGIEAGLANIWFWVALTTQLIICIGFFKFFRKEQVSKP